MTGKIDIPPLGFSLDDMVRWRADVLAGPVEAPAGWLDLADTMLRLSQRRAELSGAEATPPRVRRNWRDEAGLQVDWTWEARPCEVYRRLPRHFRGASIQCPG